MRKITDEILNEVIGAYAFQGTLISDGLFGNGHINDTLVLNYEIGKMGRMKVILQRINREVFHDPEKVMENLVGVTGFLRHRIEERGGDPLRETLNVIPTGEGASFYRDSQGEYWRAFVFITDASCYDLIQNKQEFYEIGLAFGNFQAMLAEYPAGSLHETIAGFHDTRSRFAAFKKAVEEDVAGRADEARAEIDFVLAREDVANYFSERLDRGELTLRVTHNDTKINNIMIDNRTGKAICVIDLDTVMPGLVMYDFGDAIRFGASTAAEDEKDLDKVACDMELYELFTKGFLAGCDGRLTPEEIALLPMGAKVMTYECGMRFLTDYLQGDVYFKIHRPEHNLDRCRTQFKLVADMEKKWEQMREIVSKYV